MISDDFYLAHKTRKCKNILSLSFGAVMACFWSKCLFFCDVFLWCLHHIIFIENSFAKWGKTPFWSVLPQMTLMWMEIDATQHRLKLSNEWQNHFSVVRRCACVRTFVCVSKRKILKHKDKLLVYNYMFYGVNKIVHTSIRWAHIAHTHVLDKMILSYCSSIFSFCTMFSHRFFPCRRCHRFCHHVNPVRLIRSHLLLTLRLTLLPSSTSFRLCSSTASICSTFN